MRFIVANSLLTLVFVSSAVGQPVMSDPVFAIRYDPLKVRFDSMPPSLGKTCPYVADTRYWLFAYWKEATVEYFIVSSKESPTGGAVVVFDNKQCVTGLPDWLLTGDPKYGGPYKTSVTVTEPVVRGLIADMLRRYTVAFGGKANFLVMLRKDGLPVSDKMPILKSEVEKFAGFRSLDRK